MFSLTLVFLFLNVRLISLIYVTAFVVSERLPRQEEDIWWAKRTENLNV